MHKVLLGEWKVESCKGSFVNSLGVSGEFLDNEVIVSFLPFFGEMQKLARTEDMRSKMYCLKDLWFRVESSFEDVVADIVSYSRIELKASGREFCRTRLSLLTQVPFWATADLAINKGINEGWSKTSYRSNYQEDLSKPICISSAVLRASVEAARINWVFGKEILLKKGDEECFSKESLEEESTLLISLVMAITVEEIGMSQYFDQRYRGSHGI